MDFPQKIDLVKSVQNKLGLQEDGVDGPVTWRAIDTILPQKEKVAAKIEETSSCPLSQKSFDLILKYEVGGGKGYYTKFLQKPTWPQGGSGVTIGIGYDLGYNTASQFKKDWGEKISAEDFTKLSKCLGKTGVGAHALIPSLTGIVIPWDKALEVFCSNTLPRFIKETLSAFPEADKLAPDAFGALVSLVFNRGASVSGDRRREMLNIRNLVPSKNYAAIAKEIKNMKRLWVGQGLDGLLTRRDEEAELVLACG